MRLSASGHALAVDAAPGDIIQAGAGKHFLNK
jgi:hypothetical protein